MAIRIFIVDDHRIVREGLRLRLEQEADFTVVGEAATAGEAHEALGRVAADIVILDLNLAGDSGVAVAARITNSWPSMRVVVLTGDTAPNSPQDALLAGASGYLRKEDAGDQLIAAIRTVAGGKTYLSPDAATAVAQALRTQAQPGARHPGLSDQELAVLKGMAAGQSYKEIADDLNVSPKSIETYRARLVKKTGCTTRAELVRYAIREGIVSA